jgi:antitoxin (DNA-binding transcriptional repressor) of toxin-antitoxin stability system
LSRLVDQAARGEIFVIAKAGKPLVKIVPLNALDASRAKRIGFLEGHICVPDDFNQMGQAEIEQLFGDVKLLLDTRLFLWAAGAVTVAFARGSLPDCSGERVSSSSVRPIDRRS